MGKFTGPLNKSVESLGAWRLVSNARSILGQVKERMQTLKEFIGHRNKTIAAGEVVKVFSNGYVDKAWLQITTEEVSRCKNYVESGRQRWEDYTVSPGHIDISSNITGKNGSPGSPISSGISKVLSCSKPGQALCFGEQFHKKELRYSTPPSSFTGKLHLFFQALYGSKRLDISYGDHASASVAGVSFTHEFSRSSILYTDDAEQYWVLQIVGVESATIQLWRPECRRRVADTTEIGEEAYRLWSLLPAGEAVSIPCTGTESVLEGMNGFTPCFNGWHATQKGDVGHIVVHGGVEEPGGSQSRLYKFELTDTKANRTPTQTLAEYIASRFSVTFTKVEQTLAVITSYVNSVWVPSYLTGRMKLGNERGTTFVAQDNAPVYCRYRSDDTLDIIRYFSEQGTAPEDEDPEGDISCGMGTDCWCWLSGHGLDQDVGTAGFVIGSIGPVETLSKEVKHCDLVEMIADGGTEFRPGPTEYEFGSIQEFHSMCEELPGAEGTDCEFTYWGYRAVAQMGHTKTIDSTRHSFLKRNQALVIPFYNHESFLVVEMDEDFRLIETSDTRIPALVQFQEVWIGCCLAYDEFGNCTDFREISLGGPYNVAKATEGIPEVASVGADTRYYVYSKATHFPRNGDPEVIGEREDVDGALDEGAEVSCGTLLSNGWNSYYPVGGYTLMELFPEAIFGLTTMFFSILDEHGHLISPPPVFDIESYQYSHKNSKFSGDEDMSLTLHDGYDDFILPQDSGVGCCFTGKS